MGGAASHGFLGFFLRLLHSVAYVRSLSPLTPDTAGGFAKEMQEVQLQHLERERGKERDALEVCDGETQYGDWRIRDKYHIPPTGGRGCPGRDNPHMGDLLNFLRE